MSDQEQERERLRDIDQGGLDAFLEKVLKDGLEKVGATQGSIMLVNSRENVLEIIKQQGPEYDPTKKHRRFRIGEGIAGRVAKEGTHFVSSDVLLEENFTAPLGELNFRSLLAVPIVRDEWIIGVICVDSPEINRFDDMDATELGSLAAEVSPAIENIAVDTFISDKKRFMQLKQLYEVGQELSRVAFELPNELSGLLERIATDAERVLGADLVTLYQYNEQTDKFETPPKTAGNFNNPEWMSAPVHPGDAPHRVVSKGEPQYIRSVQANSTMRAGETVRAASGLPERSSFVDREAVHSSAGVPLKSGQENVGVMFINYRTEHPFSNDEKYVIETFAAYAALAIQGARRFKEAKLLHEEQALRQTSRMVAHRLRNVLPVVSDRIERTITRHLVSGDGLEWCRIALNEIRRAQRIIKDFEMFSRAATFDCPNLLSGLDLVEKLAEAVQIALATSGASVERDCCNGSNSVKVNLDQLRGDFTNFALDSRRHNPFELSIRISCEKASPLDVESAGLNNKNSYLKVIYADNGPGVQPEHKERIFYPFHTTTAGTGLGLAIALHNAKVHAGSLIERGVHGKGVRFELYLPVVES